MTNILSSILDSTTGSVGNTITSVQNDAGQINFVAGMSDPGEMIRCGYRPELRRRGGEQDAEYAERIRPLVMALPQEEREVIMSAALRRASLDTSNGKVNAAFAGKAPWHGLGTVVSQAMSSSEAITLAGLNWAVSKQALSYTFNGETKEANDSFGIVRQDTGAYLGSVGSRYAPVQNVDGFSFLDDVIGEYGARYESAGSIYGGKSVWMLAHMPQQRFTVNGDDMEPYVLFSNCHDGSGAAWCFPTTVRVECANTFRTAHRTKHKGLSIRHTGNVKDKIKSAQEALSLAVQGFQEFKEQATELVQKKADPIAFAENVLVEILTMTQERARIGASALASSEANTREQKDTLTKAYQGQIDRRAEIMADILHRYESGRCHPQGTAWAAFNAITEHADHHTIGRQAQNTQTRLSRRLESTMQGERDELKQIAYAKALAL